jgi:hypothetical protein
MRLVLWSLLIAQLYPGQRRVRVRISVKNKSMKKLKHFIYIFIFIYRERDMKTLTHQIRILAQSHENIRIYPRKFQRNLNRQRTAEK